MATLKQMARRIIREESKSWEKPKLTRIRAFKLNKEVNISPGEGLLMLLIKREFTTVSRTDHNVKDVSYWTIPDNYRFDLQFLSSKGNMEKLARKALQETYLFQQDIVRDLAFEISKYLVGNFCFSVETLSRSNAAKLVIVVGIDILRAVAECDQVNFLLLRGKNRERIHGNDDIACSLRAFLRVPFFYDHPNPISSDESLGLVEVVAMNMFEPCDGGALEEDVCAICLEELWKRKDIRKTSCSHIFHGGCLAPWLWRKQSCPMCRSQLP